jgi:hypothetical protein
MTPGLTAIRPLILSLGIADLNGPACRHR